jgi:hypothetical protein
MNKIRMLAVTVVIGFGTAFTGLVSYADSGTYFTHVDNASNTNVPGSNTTPRPTTTWRPAAC